MEFQELQEKAIKNAKRYCEMYNIELDEDFVLLKLYEEVGELAQDILIHRKKCRPEKRLSEKKSKEELAKELADILGVIIVIAYLFDIDLENAINEKWIKRMK